MLLVVEGCGFLGLEKLHALAKCGSAAGEFSKNALTGAQELRAIAAAAERDAGGSEFKDDSLGVDDFAAGFKVGWLWNFVDVEAREGEC